MPLVALVARVALVELVVLAILLRKEILLDLVVPGGLLALLAPLAPLALPDVPTDSLSVYIYCLHILSS